MNRRIPIVVLALAAAGAAGWYVLWPREEPANDGTIVLYGNVDVRQVELGFRVGGRLARMHLEEGDPVAAGQLLAELDSQPLEDNVRLAEAQVALQQANLQKFEAGSRPAEIAQAEAQVAERQSELDNIVRNLNRQAQLLDSGFAAQQAYDDLRSQRSEAEARLRSAQRAYDLVAEGFRAEDVEAARANLDIAEASLARALTDLADARLTAPEGGVVLTRIAEPGAIMAAGAPVYAVTLSDPVWVRAYVTEPDLGRIHAGMAASVATDSAPDRAYAGHIGFISPVAEFTPKSVETADLRTDLVYRLRVIVDDPDNGLRQGMPVTVTLEPAP
ncbi:MAG: secretion protein HlyD [Alphaproteobacteria bacterium]